ncbi:MAG: cell division protein FtsW [Lachnospiraceae bacterium]|nr:cell division protein FtsW [Lachnospiraceae bacterium]
MTFAKHKNFEYILFTSVIFLVVFGLIVLYSASSVQAMRIYGSPTYFFIRQAIFCAAGIIIMLVVSSMPYRLFTRFSKYLYIGVLMLVIVTAFSGRISRGASRWINFRGVIFQPSELMKLALILYLPKVVEELKGDFEKKDNLIRFMIVAYVPAFVVTLANLSTGIILFIIATSIIFVVSKKYLVFVFALTMFVVAYVFAYPLSQMLNNAGLLKDYQMGRILAWKDPENYPDTAYQTLQGLYAIGRGRIYGNGYLASIQKSLLPEAQNDMIFAVLCEELGLVGAGLFIALYLILIYRIFYISIKSKRLMPMLITFGIGIHIAIQVILNIGVVTNVLPNTGVTLPFVSYGGTSLLVTFVEVGIVMSISKISFKESEV